MWPRYLPYMKRFQVPKHVWANIDEYEYAKGKETRSFIKEYQTHTAMKQCMVNTQ